jgi:hypothetical protein
MIEDPNAFVLLRSWLVIRMDGRLIGSGVVSVGLSAFQHFRFSAII